MRKRFLKWLIKKLLPQYSLYKKGARKKSLPEVQAAKEFYRKEGEREGNN